MKNSFRFLIVLAVFAVILLPPVLLRKSGSAPVIAPSGMERLVIITPHTDSIKMETGNAFRKYYKAKTGKDIYLDFRSPGGTSDIVRFIADQYKISFRDVCKEKGIPWTNEVATGFSSSWTDKDPKADPDAKRARKLFLESEVGIGIDLMYGGGVFDMARHADSGYAVDAGIAQENPELFDPAILPQNFGGENIYDKNGCYYGLVLSTFGLCVNRDRLRELGNFEVKRWSDLGDYRLYNNVIVADPTKSGSVNKCFEIMIQQCMAEAGGPDAGWISGLNMIKRIIANAATVTDSAGKITRDVAAGTAAAGMAIDTYGLTELEWNTLQFNGKAHFAYIAPEGGTAVSPDPIQLLRGAPNRKAAKEFIRFLLTKEGQQIFCFKSGVPGGPERYALRRPPVRKDLYAEQYKPLRSDPEYDPYKSGASFVYHAAWTGRYFNLLRVLIRVLMLDCQDEMKAAWKAIGEAGGPDAVPEAMKHFNALPFDYAGASAAYKSLSGSNGAMAVLKVKSEWRDFMREHYLTAEKIARESKK